MLPKNYYRQMGWLGACGANRDIVPQPREMQLKCYFIFEYQGTGKTRDKLQWHFYLYFSWLRNSVPFHPYSSRMSWVTPSLTVKGNKEKFDCIRARATWCFHVDKLHVAFTRVLFSVPMKEKKTEVDYTSNYQAVFRNFFWTFWSLSLLKVFFPLKIFKEERKNMLFFQITVPPASHSV